MTFMPDIETAYPNGDDLYDARRNARLDVPSAAALCGVRPITIKRQESGKNPVNLPYYRLMLARAGWLIDPAWHGWSRSRPLMDARGLESLSGRGSFAALSLRTDRGTAKTVTLSA